MKNTAENFSSCTTRDDRESYESQRKLNCFRLAKISTSIEGWIRLRFFKYTQDCVLVYEYPQLDKIKGEQFNLAADLTNMPILEMWREMSTSSGKFPSLRINVVTRKKANPLTVDYVRSKSIRNFLKTLQYSGLHSNRIRSLLRPFQNITGCGALKCAFPTFAEDVSPQGWARELTKAVDQLQMGPEKPASWAEFPPIEILR